MATLKLFNNQFKPISIPLWSKNIGDSTVLAVVKGGFQDSRI